MPDGASASGRVGGRSSDMEVVLCWCRDYGCGGVDGIACGILFSVRRKNFATEGWHYNTKGLVCDIRGLHVGTRLARC